MFNPYVIILALFALAGLIIAVWGWRLIAKGRATRRWPTAEGIVENEAQTDDKTPILYVSYSVNGHAYRQALALPDEMPSVGTFTARHFEKFPAGARIQVHYDPAHPERITLEPGLGRGDWLVFAAGIAAMLFGMLALLFGK